MYYYTAYGLNINSSIPLIGQQSKGTGLNVKIIKGKLNKLFLDNCTEFKISENLKLIKRFDSESLFWQNIEICRIINENKIVINSSSSLKEDFIRIILLDIAIPLLLTKKKMLMLHANVVNLKGNGVAFLGPSGVGKSTTSILLDQKGYKLISDDISCIRINKKKDPTVFSGFSTIKLGAEIIKILGKNPEEMPKIHHNLNKYLYDNTEFQNKSIPLKSIYILKRSNNTYIQDISPQSAMIELINNTLLGKVFSSIESFDNLNHCAYIVNNVNVKILNVKNSLNYIYNLVNVIEKDFFKNLNKY